MITEYIPKVITFTRIAEEKYENCLTREEFIKKVEEKVKLMGPEIMVPEAQIDPEMELFCGDHIIGHYQKGEKWDMCLYEWKRNNPHEILGYCRLHKFKLKEKVGDIELIIHETHPNFYGSH